jgi:hypothetical protein
MQMSTMRYKTLALSVLVGAVLTVVTRSNLPIAPYVSYPGAFIGVLLYPEDLHAGLTIPKVAIPFNFVIYTGISYAALVLGSRITRRKRHGKMTRPPGGGEEVVR